MCVWMIAGRKRRSRPAICASAAASAAGAISRWSAGRYAVAILDQSSTVGPLIKSLIAEGLPLSVHQVDLTDRARVCAVTDEVATRLGTPTILVNNAGLGSSPDAPADENGRFETYPESAW